MAHLNITFNGLSADYPLELDAQVSDVDIRRIAVEIVRSGGMAGLHVPHVADDAFDHFMVDRLQNGERIYLRPKVPFG
jgi:hypothetical protein